VQIGKHSNMVRLSDHVMYCVFKIYHQKLLQFLSTAQSDLSQLKTMKTTLFMV